MNLNIMSIKTYFKLSSKQMLTFSRLNEHNSKSETQSERLNQCECLDCCEHV